MPGGRGSIDYRKAIVGGFSIEVLNEEVLKDLERIGANVPKVLEEALLAGAEVVIKAANDLAPGPHIIHGEVKADNKSAEVNIGADDDHWYYRFFETGASPHYEAPRKGSVLHFFSGGDEVFARFVSRGGGTPQRPYLRPAIDENHDKINKAAGEVIEKALK